MIINVKVFPNSGREEIVHVSDGEYKIYLKKPAENNKANIELVKILTKHFGEDVKILKGKTSRRKVVEVKDGDKIPTGARR